MTIPDPPAGWKITHMILLDPEWQVIIHDDEHVVVATGDSIDEALTNATQKAFEGIYAGRLFSGLHMDGPVAVKIDINALMNLRRPTIERRI